MNHWKSPMSRSFDNQGEAIVVRHESGKKFTGFKEAAAHFGVSDTAIAHYAHGRRKSRVGRLEIVGRAKKYVSEGKSIVNVAR